MSKQQNIVGPIVRELREKSEQTQDQLAAKLNLKGWDLSRATLSKIEAQVRCVTDFEVFMLAEGLGIEGAELLRKAGKNMKHL